MEFIHAPLPLKVGQRILVDLDQPANVRLIVATDLGRFRSGRAVPHWGGAYSAGRVVLPAPRSGRFELILDRGERGGRIGYAIQVEG